MHGGVAQGHYHDVQRLGILEQVEEARPSVKEPASGTGSGGASDGFHDPFLLFGRGLVVEIGPFGSILGDGEFLYGR